MAGGKETGRQKMIGMMYLVLTALLALNVSSTVIEKFIFLNDSLERANSETVKRNVQILGAMKKSVEEKGGKKEDMDVIADADKLRAETARVVAALDEYKKKFIEETGGYEEGFDGNVHHIKGKTNYDGVGHYMMPEEEGGQGHGKEMRKLLSDYKDLVSKLMKDNKASAAVLEQFHNLTPDADEDPIYKEDPNQQGKKWSQLAFEYSPTHAGLATVSELQADVLSFETRGLDYLQTRTGLSEIVFDEIKAMVNPVSKYVLSGNKYEAEMFIAASASAASPVMKYNGSNLQVNNGVGKVEFVANLNGGEDAGNGIKKKTFKAEITVPTAGGDTTFASTIEYFVVKPAVVVSSNTAVSLYKDCANDVRISVPGMTGNYNPVFSVKTGKADLIKGGTPGELNIVPTSAVGSKVTVGVSNAGQPIGDTQPFTVNEVPAPSIVAKVGARVLSPDVPIPTSTPRVNIAALADEAFAKGHKKDARFLVTKAEANILRGGDVVKKVQVKNGDLRIPAGMRKGDTMIVKIEQVYRKNFRDKTVAVPKFTKSVTITFR